MIKFKLQRIHYEWKDTRIPSFLKRIIRAADRYCSSFGCNLLLTSIYRSPEENKRLRAKSHTHCEWRAIDLVACHQNGERNLKITDDCARYINQTFGHHRPLWWKVWKIAVYHKMKRGAPHVHVQVWRNCSVE